MRGELLHLFFTLVLVVGAPSVTALAQSHEPGNGTFETDRAPLKPTWASVQDPSISELTQQDFAISLSDAVLQPGWLEVNVVDTEPAKWVKLSAEQPVSIEESEPVLWTDADYEPEVRAGEESTFRLLYGNTGGYENNVRIRNEFPPEARFASSAPLPERMSITGLWAEWDVGDLGKDDQGSIDVTVAIAGDLVPSTTVEIWDYIYNHVGWEMDAFRITYHITDTACEPITGVDFDWSPISPQTGEVVTFTASLQPSTAILPIAYQWGFGDGGTATGSPVYHTYTTSGTFSASVNATNACGNAVEMSHDVTAEGPTVTPTYGVELTPATAAKSGTPRETVIYQLSVHNTGDTADTFDLSFKDLDGWTTGVSPASANLLPGDAIPVSIAVNVPPDASGDHQDVATITATSQGGPTASASSTLTTTGRFVFYLPAVFRTFYTE
jgi:hypothetical protein